MRDQFSLPTLSKIKGWNQSMFQIFRAVGGAYLFSPPRVFGVTKKFSEINNTKHVNDELNLQRCWWSSQRSASPRGVR
jgi:hypothetical protein